MTTVASRNGQGSPTPTLRIPAFSAASIPAASQSKATHSEGSAPSSAACCKSGSGSDLAYETRLPSNTQSNRERIPVRSRIAGASRPAEPSPTEIPSRRSPSSRETAPGSTSALGHPPDVFPVPTSLARGPFLLFVRHRSGLSDRPPAAGFRAPRNGLTPRSDSFCNSVNSNPSSAASLFHARKRQRAVSTITPSRLNKQAFIITLRNQSVIRFKARRLIGASGATRSATDRYLFQSIGRKREKSTRQAQPDSSGLPNGPYRETRYRPGRTLRKQALPPQDQGR